VVWLSRSTNSLNFSSIATASGCAAKDAPRKASAFSLERIPMELLTLLLERRGSVVARQEIVDCLSGKDVFLDSEHGINTPFRNREHL
jgi:DNA-binding response OmpR family regulator